MDVDLSLDMGAPLAADRVVETARERGAVHRLWLTYWRLPTLYTWRERWPDVHLVYATIPVLPWHARTLFTSLTAAGIDAVNIHHRFCREALLAQAHAEDLGVFAWGVRTAGALNRVVARGVDGVYCDDANALAGLARAGKSNDERIGADTRSGRPTPSHGLRARLSRLRMHAGHPSRRAYSTDMEAHSELHTALARLYFGLGEFERELEAAERASELARLSGDQITLAVADTRRGAVLAALGREAEALEVLEVAASLAEVTHNSGTQSSALQYIGEIYLFAAQIEESRERFEQALHLVTQTDVPRRIATVTARLGRVAAITGDWTQAHELFSRAMTVDDSQGRSSPYLFPMLLDAQLCVHEGRWAEASRVLDTVAQHARPGSDRWILQFAAGIRAQKAIFEGVPDLANELLTPILARNDVVRRLRYTLLVILAEATIDAGRIADAETALTTMTDDVRGWARMLLPDVLCLRARALILRGNLEEADAALREAVSTADGIRSPYSRARALVNQVTLYRAGENFEAAGAAAADVERVFARLGARFYWERVSFLP